MKAKLTVIVPTFNRLRLLKVALKSCMAQSISNFDLLIIDNASTDGTHEFLNSVQKEYPRIKVVFNETNIGALRSLQKAIDLVKTEWATVLCDDDCLESDFVKTTVALTSENTSLIIVSHFESDQSNETYVNVKSKLFQSQLEALYMILSGRVRTAGVGGFAFKICSSGELALPKFPNGFFSDTFLVCQTCLQGGVVTTEEALYRRTLWSGSETNLGGGAKNRSMYRKARMLFKIKMLGELWKMPLADMCAQKIYLLKAVWSLATLR